MNTPALLAASGLSFSRNDEPVFGPLDFHVDAGEALLLLEEAKRANQRAAGQIQLALDEAAKQLATR